MGDSERTAGLVIREHGRYLLGNKTSRHGNAKRPVPPVTGIEDGGGFCCIEAWSIRTATFEGMGTILIWRSGISLRIYVKYIGAVFPIIGLDGVLALLL